MRFRKGYPVAKDLRDLAEEMGVRCYPSDAYPMLPQLVNSYENQNDKVDALVERLKALGVPVKSHTQASTKGWTNGVIVLDKKPPASLTAKIICEEAAKRHGLTPDMVEIHRDEGTWYWSGKVGSVFTNGNMIGYMKLNDWSLERWLEDFDMNVEIWQKDAFNADRTLRQYIDGINWVVKKEPTVLEAAYKGSGI